MRGRPQKPWSVERVRDMLLELPSRAVSVHKLKALVNYKRYPDRWEALMIAIALAPGFEGQGRMFAVEHVDGVMSVVLKDRGY